MKKSIALWVSIVSFSFTIFFASNPSFAQLKREYLGSIKLVTPGHQEFETSSDGRWSHHYFYLSTYAGGGFWENYWSHYGSGPVKKWNLYNTVGKEPDPKTALKDGRTLYTNEGTYLISARTTRWNRMPQSEKNALIGLARKEILKRRPSAQFISISAGIARDDSDDRKLVDSVVHKITAATQYGFNKIKEIAEKNAHNFLKTLEAFHRLDKNQAKQSGAKKKKYNTTLRAVRLANHDMKKMILTRLGHDASDSNAANMHNATVRAEIPKYFTEALDISWDKADNDKVLKMHHATYFK